jgi:hypothetical protein
VVQDFELDRASFSSFTETTAVSHLKTLIRNKNSAQPTVFATRLLIRAIVERAFARCPVGDHPDMYRPTNVRSIAFAHSCSGDSKLDGQEDRGDR